VVNFIVVLVNGTVVATAGVACTKPLIYFGHSKEEAAVPSVSLLMCTTKFVMSRATRLHTKLKFYKMPPPHFPLKSQELVSLIWPPLHHHTMIQCTHFTQFSYSSQNQDVPHILRVLPNVRSSLDSIEITGEEQLRTQMLVSNILLVAILWSYSF